MDIFITMVLLQKSIGVIFIGLCTHAFIEGIPIQSFIDTNQSHVHANEINLESSFSWLFHCNSHTQVTYCNSFNVFSY